MTAYNDVSPLAPRLRIYCKAFKEALVSYLEAKRGNSDVILAGVELFDRADATLRVMEKKEAAIATDARLSPVGRQEQMANVAAEFHPQLRFVGDGGRDRRNAAAEIQKKLTAVPRAQSNETTDYLTGYEIRTRLAKLPMAERMKIVSEAMTHGRAHVLRAVMTDPLGEELIEPEFLDRLQEQQAQKNDGREWVRLQSLTFVAERLEQLSAAVHLQLSHYNEIPSFQGTPTRTTDLAYTDTQAAPPKNTAVDQPPAGGSSFQ